MTLKVGVIPIADVAPLYLGIKQGFFEEENLTIEPQLAEGGAAIIPSVMSGDYQIGFSNAVSLLIAASKDLPVQIISQGVLGGTTQDDAWDAVVVPKGSDVKTRQGPRGQDDRGQHAQQHRPGHDQQRAGEERAPTTRRSSTSRCRSRRWARRSRPSASTRRSRSSRRTRGAVAAGGTPIFSSYVETAPNLTVATYFASKQYIAENEDIIQRFKRAMEKSLEYAAPNEAEVRAVVGEYTQIPAEVTDKIHLPTWKADLNEPTIQTAVRPVAQVRLHRGAARRWMN